MDYGDRFVKFIRASTKTREEVAREKVEAEKAIKEAEEGVEPSTLPTIEEREDRRILERAREQMRRESMGREEMDVGRRTSLSPTGPRPEQFIPSVTVQPSNQGPSDDSITPIDGRMESVGSPIEEKSFIVEESYVSEKAV